MARRPPVDKPVSPAAAVAEQPAKKPMSRRAPAPKATPAAEPAPESTPVLTPAPMGAADPMPAPAPSTSGRLFSVTRSHGPAWESPLPREQQVEWAAHAEFMNGLAADGFVVLGGPLED